MKRRDGFILSLLIIVLFVLEIFVAYHFFTTKSPGAADFYSRWHGARALLIEGRNPYALDVTEEIQPVIGIDPRQVGKGGFNYPLHVIFFFWPLVYLPYAWVQAVWSVVLQWLSVGIAVGILAFLDWKPDQVTRFVALILMTISFYPTTRSIFLGQFTIHVLFFVVLALIALKRNHDIWAGIFFSAASIKPQLVIFIGLWLVFWVIGQKRWRFFWGLFGGGLAFLLASMALMPSWPLRFLEDLPRYRRFAGGRLPIQLLFDYLWPAAPDFIWQGVAGLLIVVMLVVWWRNWRAPIEEGFKQSLIWAIVLGLFLVFQTGTTNQVLLLIPLFIWLDAARQRWGFWLPWVGIVLAWISTWVVFLWTIKGNYEHEMMFLVLTIPALATLIWQIPGLWREKSSTSRLSM